LSIAVHIWLCWTLKTRHSYSSYLAARRKAAPPKIRRGWKGRYWFDVIKYIFILTNQDPLFHLPLA
jgi:hypothetical protein